jgi:hypothetical protein
VPAEAAGRTLLIGDDFGGWESQEDHATLEARFFAGAVRHRAARQVRETLNGATSRTAAYRWTVDLPKACVLRVARARVFVYTKRDKARLVIHYTTYRPARVSVAYSLRGSRGSLALRHRAIPQGRRLPAAGAAGRGGGRQGPRREELQRALPDPQDPEQLRPLLRQAADDPAQGLRSDRLVPVGLGLQRGGLSAARGPNGAGRELSGTRRGR